MSKVDRLDQDGFIESQIIMTVVRTIAPFTLVYGFFQTFHGANAPGGAFQGGTVVGATVLMIAFAFGISRTRKWIENKLLTSLIASGAVFLGFLGFSGIMIGGYYLDHQIFGFLRLEHGLKLGIEALEIGGIFPVVAGTIIGLFYVTAAGVDKKPEKRGVQR